MKAERLRAMRKPSSGQIFFGEKDAVNQAADVVLEQHLREFLAVDRSFFQTAEFGLEVVEELAVLPFQKVRAVDAMCLQHRVRKERAFCASRLRG